MIGTANTEDTTMDGMLLWWVGLTAGVFLLAAAWALLDGTLDRHRRRDDRRDQRDERRAEPKA
jgi:hypothetical protein